MAAAALRFTAKRLCRGALERAPQAFLTAAKELAGPTRTLPSRHGGTSLRRLFSSSTESSSAPNLRNKINNEAESMMTSLSAQAREKMEELHDILVQMTRRQRQDFAREFENQTLIQDMLGELRPKQGYFIANHARSST